MTKAPRIERDVKREVKKLLDDHKFFWWMTPANGFGATGISDILAFKSGVLIAIETKFGSRKTTAQQRGFLHSIQAENGFAFVVNEKNLDWFRGFLEVFDKTVIETAKGGKVSPDDGAYLLNAIKELTEGFQ